MAVILGCELDENHVHRFQDYIYRDGQLLATSVNAPEKVRHFHRDHLGTPRLITGNGGAELASHTYYPFGEQVTPVPPDNESMKFTGHERDAATLDYMHARYYSPVWGRFLSVDPGPYDPRQPQTWNRYSYVANNPINRTDPTGRCFWDLCIVEGMATVAIVTKAVVATAVVVGVAYGVYQNVFNERADPYAPDRNLPTDPVTGNPVIDDGTVGPHTQLGKRTGSNGDVCVQGREFDENGKRVKDIDFTDHDRKDHASPHEHPYDPATGKRGPQQPLQPGKKPDPKQPKAPEAEKGAMPDTCAPKTVC